MKVGITLSVMQGCTQRPHQAVSDDPPIHDLFSHLRDTEISVRSRGL